MPPAPTDHPRVAFLESIRGLAAVQVVLLHFFSAFIPDLVFEPTAPGLASSIHLSPLYFLYDGYSAVYLFFMLSGYVLTRSFERHLDHPFALVAGRILRLAVPALAAVLVAAAIMMWLGRPNAEAGALSGSTWFAGPRMADVSWFGILRDGIGNAVFLGYLGLPGIGFLAPWQQPLDHSFVAPLWTLSIEFYGSLLVLALCLCARRSRVAWWIAVIVTAVVAIRSSYLCFVAGHLLASYRCAERQAMDRPLIPAIAIVLGIFLCVRAEVWQFEWLRTLCADPTPWLFPGQSPAQQQKTFGALLLFIGLIHLQTARAALSRPWLVRQSRLSFPLYLVHWPILYGPAALLFLSLHGVAGLAMARAGAIVAGIALAFAASLLFLPVDRGALALSRLVRKWVSAMSNKPKIPARTGAAPAVAAE